MKSLGLFEAGQILRVRATLSALEQAANQLSMINNGIPVKALTTELNPALFTAGVMLEEATGRLSFSEDFFTDKINHQRSQYS